MAAACKCFWNDKQWEFWQWRLARVRAKKEADNVEKLRRYKKEILMIIHEYFLSGYIPELIRSLVELGSPEYNPIFLKKLITLSMDRKNPEKERASVLLPKLCVDIFWTRDIFDGFVLLLESADDTALDIPDASNELALFLARAVIDHVLAPLNLIQIGYWFERDSNGSKIVDMAWLFVNDHYAKEKLRRCWGGGTWWTFEDVEDKIVKLLEEYQTGSFVAEACECIRDLGMPFFNHEVVKKALVMEMKMKIQHDSMLDLLQQCYSEGLITTNQITIGFNRVKDALPYLALEIPNAEEKFNLYYMHAAVRGWLLPVFSATRNDDILSTAFVTRTKKSLTESSKGLQVLGAAVKSYLSATDHAQLVERRCGGSIHVSVEEVKKRISHLFREYAESGDSSEVCWCIRHLGVPFFHPEIVERALVLSMDNRAAEPLILMLLKEASEEGLISSSQMTKGFSRLRENLEDLALDIPSVKYLFESLAKQAVVEGWLDASFSNSSGDGILKLTEAKDDEKLRRYKKEIVMIIHEYFLSGYTPELIRSLVELGSPEYNPIFLKKLITLAMDRKNQEKERASDLLSKLCFDIFSIQDIVDGFVLLLESADDTALDIPNASNELALFLARAVIDDVLAPLNLVQIENRLERDSNGSKTVHVAQSFVAAPHAFERLRQCWGGGTWWTFEDAEDKIVKLLQEYETGPPGALLLKLVSVFVIWGCHSLTMRL